MSDCIIHTNILLRREAKDTDESKVNQLQEKESKGEDPSDHRKVTKAELRKYLSFNCRYYIAELNDKINASIGGQRLYISSMEYFVQNNNMQEQQTTWFCTKQYNAYLRGRRAISLHMECRISERRIQAI